MTDKELHKLSRKDLLQLMIEQQTKVDQCKQEYAKLELDYHKTKLSNEHLIEKLDNKDQTIEGLKEKLVVKDEKMAALIEKLDQKDLTLESFKQKLNQKDEKIAEFIGKMDAKDLRIEELSGDFNREELRTALRQKNEEAAALSRERDSLEKQSETLKEENRKIKEEIALLKLELKDAGRSLEISKMETEVLRRSLDDMREQKREDLESERVRHKAMVSELVQRQETERKAWNEDKDLLQSELRMLRQELDEKKINKQMQAALGYVAGKINELR